MEETQINSWKDFEEKIVIKCCSGNNEGVNKQLFRGQSNSEWELESTLTRIKPNCSWEEYHKILMRIQRKISSLTNRNWELDEKPNYNLSKSLCQFDRSLELMVYLRHHIFPSPLLDWTRSPYVAAFFAFRDFEAKKINHVAIFTMKESDIRSGWMGQATIDSIGPDIKTHKRHFLQQCEYTYAWKEQEKERIYCSYDEAIKNENAKDQIKLEQFILPGSLQKDFLYKLNTMNINNFSLFQTEEALMHTLAIDEFILTQ